MLDMEWCWWLRVANPTNLLEFPQTLSQCYNVQAKVLPVVYTCHVRICAIEYILPPTLLNNVLNASMHMCSQA